MSVFSFINLTGSSETEKRNKKLVRSHVAKYFHPNRRAMDGTRYQRSPHIGNCRPRRIAPRVPRRSGSILFSPDQCPIMPQEFDWQTQPSQIATILDGHLTVTLNAKGSSKASSITGPNNEEFGLDEGLAENQIDSAAVVDLLKLGASRGKNLRIGWLRGGRIIIRATMAINSSLM